MAYDASKDKLLFDVAFIDNGDQQIAAGIFSYSGGPAKLRIQRKIHTHSGTKTASLGGVTRAEAKIALDVLTQALALPEDKWPEEGKKA